MRKILFTFLICLFYSTHSFAEGGLDGFLNYLNVQAKADLPGFYAKVSAQFGVSEIQVKAVFSTVKQPANTFMIFQLGQMSRQPTDTVLRVYQHQKGKGWGVIAKELGIKPGSPEFHALKRGDLHLEGMPNENQPKNKVSHGHGHGHGHGKPHKE